ncbi:hypothetical protein EVAR_8802_1 [Eumeta japonica]|uniref:Reverse transcriptase domain-containing protein n=1 Tax=Eumeta variegata TaxID=151549 RepID=A0A4C1TU66_EUMVA|nr:hypothetical protein EVAR_8802_1 [Eumeta japonica]
MKIAQLLSCPLAVLPRDRPTAHVTVGMKELAQVKLVDSRQKQAVSPAAAPRRGRGGSVGSPTRSSIWHFQTSAQENLPIELQESYGFRKIYKPGGKLKPVVSNIGSSGYEIAKYGHPILSAYVRSLRYNVKDSFHFVEQIKSTRAGSNQVLISLDVVSLFTNILIDLIKKILTERFFWFWRKFLLPKDSMCDGNPASPSIAIISVDDVISEALSRLDFEVPILKAYVDGLFAVVPTDRVNEILNMFNSIDKHIHSGDGN